MTLDTYNIMINSDNQINSLHWFESNYQIFFPKADTWRWKLRQHNILGSAWFVKLFFSANESCILPNVISFQGKLLYTHTRKFCFFNFWYIFFLTNPFLLSSSIEFSMPFCELFLYILFISVFLVFLKHKLLLYLTIYGLFFRPPVTLYICNHK